MFAGLPGTGIAGLLYAGLAVTMPFRWLWRIATGRARRGEGRAVARLVALVAAIGAALVLEGVLLTSAASAARAAGGPIGASVPHAEVTSAWVAPLALAGVASLAFLLLAVQALRLVVRARPTPLPPGAKSAATMSRPRPASAN